MRTHVQPLPTGRHLTAEEKARVIEHASELHNGNVVQLTGLATKTVVGVLSRTGGFATRRTDRGLCYTTSDVARHCGVSRLVVQRWIARGCLRAEALPPLQRRSAHTVIRWRVAIADVDVFIETYPFLFCLTTFPTGPHRATLVVARPEEWVKGPVAMRLLRVKRSTFRRIVHGGDLPVRLYGRAWWARREDVERLRRERARERDLRQARSS